MSYWKKSQKAQKNISFYFYYTTPYIILVNIVYILPLNICNM